VRTDRPLVTMPKSIDNFRIIAVQGEGVVVELQHWRDALYKPSRMLNQHAKSVKFTAIPYFAWANREAGPMIVWMARA